MLALEEPPLNWSVVTSHAPNPRLEAVLEVSDQRFRRGRRRLGLKSGPCGAAGALH